MSRADEEVEEGPRRGMAAAAGAAVAATAETVAVVAAIGVRAAERTPTEEEARLVTIPAVALLRPRTTIIGTALHPRTAHRTTATTTTTRGIRTTRTVRLPVRSLRTITGAPSRSRKEMRQDGARTSATTGTTTAAAFGGLREMMMMTAARGRGIEVAAAAEAIATGAAVAGPTRGPDPAAGAGAGAEAPPEVHHRPLEGPRRRTCRRARAASAARGRTAPTPRDRAGRDRDQGRCHRRRLLRRHPLPRASPPGERILR